MGLLRDVANSFHVSLHYVLNAKAEH